MQANLRVQELSTSLQVPVKPVSHRMSPSTRAVPSMVSVLMPLQTAECSAAFLQELRAEMEFAASAASDREDLLRGEVRRAEDRMRAAETAASEAASQSGDSTKPLLRQIEAMAASTVRSISEQTCMQTSCWHRINPSSTHDSAGCAVLSGCTAGGRRGG